MESLESGRRDSFNAKHQRPNRRLSNTLRQSHANLNQKEMAKRYTGMQPLDTTQGQMDLSSAVAECKSCYTENYLVFSLGEKLPQETRQFLEKEDDVLDYCKTVNFNRNAKRLEHAAGVFDQGSNSTNNMPDEIDGDDRLGASRRAGIRSTSMLVSTDTELKYSVDSSIYIDSGEINESVDKVRRYSVIGNDPSFKQYTKNHDYDTTQYQEQRKQDSEGMNQSVLSVSLKDLASSEFNNNVANSEQEGGEGGDQVREQYRVVKKDLLFKVNFQQSNSKYHHGENQVVTERTLSDFRKLGNALQKLFPGCFVPIIPKQSVSIDLPQSIFDFRKTPMECAQVENFCRKLRECPYLLDSDAVQLFMDPRIFQVQLDSQLSNLVKQTSTQADTLNRFKQSFNNLSGKQVDSQTFSQIDKFRTFIIDQQKHLFRFRSIVERAMTNKVEYDNSTVKLFQAMADMEDFIAADLGDNRVRMRSEQRVLDKFAEVNNDTHWRALEAVDDFIRDQLADCQALVDCFNEIAKQYAKYTSVKQSLDSKTQNFISQEKKQVPAAKVKQARSELDMTEVSFYEASLCYNIMIINMSYVTIEQFKSERRTQFNQFLRTVCQTRIVQENEMHGFFKFVLNFYHTDF